MRAQLLILLTGTLFAAGAQTIQLDKGIDLAHRVQLSSGRAESGLTVNPNQLSLDFLDSLSPVRRPSSLSIRALPVTWLQEYNSDHSTDWNYGSMIPARGYQLAVSAGVHVSFGNKLELQFAPEFAHAQNQDGEIGFSHAQPDIFWNSYYHWLNTSDIPQRFGSKSYTRVYPGQSYIRYNSGKIRFGLSTENLWWGPGTLNSLVMTNNAPGFLHATISTPGPIKTGIGSFEGEVIAGKLDDSGIDPPEPLRVYNGQFLYQPKLDEWRYLTGWVLSWQPRWIPNFFIGFAKSSYLYHSDIQGPLDALPLQGFAGSSVTRSEKDGKKSSMGSFFFRYVLPKSQAEIYWEYGRADASLMPWNFFRSPQYRRGYVFGTRKLFNTSRADTKIQALVELTQLEVPTSDLIFQPRSWYTDLYVRQGYTNMGRVIGAGIGPGSNSETLEISWVRKLKRIGLRLERVNQNADFHYYAFTYISDFRRHWVDLSGYADASWDYKNFIFSARLGLTQSANYNWFLVQTNNNYFSIGDDRLNFTGRVGVSYRF